MKNYKRFLSILAVVLTLTMGFSQTAFAASYGFSAYDSLGAAHGGNIGYSYVDTALNALIDWGKTNGYSNGKGYVFEVGNSSVAVGVVLADTPINYANGDYVRSKSVSGYDTKTLAIQKALKALNYSVVADGYFGTNTESAVKAFQTKHGLTADGIVGKGTYYQLSKASY